eukprot:gene9595-10606_t
MQFDSRPLARYWNVSANWNAAYARRYGHRYLFWSLAGESCQWQGTALAASWCKVKAMLDMDSRLAEGEAVLFLDSDSLLTLSYSLSAMWTFIQQARDWNWTSQPMAFNQDGPGYACSTTLRLGYPFCLNSGTVFWLKSPLSTKMLATWWKAASQSLTWTSFPMDWKTKWPWEQAAQHELYQMESRHIMLLSFPLLAYLPWTNRGRPSRAYPDEEVQPWCLSHWPGAGCFITHFCASKRQKIRLEREYQHNPYWKSRVDFDINYISL